MTILKRILLIILALLLVVVIAFTVWAYTPLGPSAEALVALQSDDQVMVETRPWLTFRPAQGAPTTGLVLYPGGRVDPRSYAPQARDIAAQGYLVVIPPMPFNLAVFGSGRAGDVIAMHPEIERWAVGGHSLGGAMAANYLHGQHDARYGLALWASYPAGNNSLAGRALPATSVYGTADGVASIDTILAANALLPPDTPFVSIEGGNHAQFGSFGAQPGDNAATIDADMQRAQTVAATLALLERLP
jgi:pimeloyl-ACP methyl ester carboxylesterase